jgi:hypothetical protein
LGLLKRCGFSTSIKFVGVSFYSFGISVIFGLTALFMVISLIAPGSKGLSIAAGAMGWFDLTFFLKTKTGYTESSIFSAGRYFGLNRPIVGFSNIPNVSDDFSTNLDGSKGYSLAILTNSLMSARSFESITKQRSIILSIAGMGLSRLIRWFFLNSSKS